MHYSVRISISMCVHRYYSGGGGAESRPPWKSGCHFFMLGKLKAKCNAMQHNTRQE